MKCVGDLNHWAHVSLIQQISRAKVVCSKIFNRIIEKFEQKKPECFSSVNSYVMLYWEPVLPHVSKSNLDWCAMYELTFTYFAVIGSSQKFSTVAF
jgi:hypothetical protein